MRALLGRPSARGPAIWPGLVAFTALTFGLTWASAWLVRGLFDARALPMPTRLLGASLAYLVTMGWQPLLALRLVRRWVEPPKFGLHGLAAAPRRFLVVAALAPLLVAALAVALAWFLFDGAPEAAVLGFPEVEVAAHPPSFAVALRVVLAAVATIVLLALQALAEEVAWRGYFLDRLMQSLGAWQGLLLHGAVWGLWYAPVFLFTAGHAFGGTVDAIAFVFTCAFLGALLGWLRLASRSVVPAALANAVLTVVAGLPFVLEGLDIGLRGAAYGPAGWLPMGALLVALVVGGCAGAVRVPPLVEQRPRGGAWFERRSLH